MTLFFFKGRKAREQGYESDAVAKLFFDSFSKRVFEVERGVKALGGEIGKLRISADRSQISDLVLLERLQKAEGMLAESLDWVKRVADSVVVARERSILPLVQQAPELAESLARTVSPNPIPFQRVLVPGVEAGSLSSITTPTELQVLALLSEHGPKSAPEIGRVIGRSREHSARLMKKLFEEGYVRREQTRIPFRYSVVERVRASLKKPEKKDEAQQEAAAVPA